MKISFHWGDNDSYGVSNHRLFAEPFVQAQIKNKIKAPRHRPLWRESIPFIKAGNVENVFMCWHHHKKGTWWTMQADITN